MTVTQLTRLTLMDLLNTANKHYDEKYLSMYFDVASGGRKAGSGDTLAEFIVSELREGFDGKSSREQQVAAAVRMLERAKEDIQNAIVGLQELESSGRINVARKGVIRDGPPDR